MTISDFEDFIKENNCSDMLIINHSRLLIAPYNLWFWISLKENSEKAVILDKSWLDFICKKAKNDTKTKSI